MKTFITLENSSKNDLPPKFRSNDNRFTDSLVEYFLQKFTLEGDSILDPFAGFGTTLVVAEEMKRVPYGIEYDEEKYRYIKSILSQKNNIIHGDAFELLSYDLPRIDFSITSPPYMTHVDHPKFPLTAYSTEGTYDQYIAGLGKIYASIKKILKPDGYAIVEVANLQGSVVTPLAWDVAREISNVLHFEGEIIVCWEGEEKKDGHSYGYGYDHSYCLIFKKK